MSRPIVAAVAFLLAVGTVFRGGTLAQQRPTFRGATTRVSVDVSVKRGKVPVGRLGADDFTIADNGVPQKVEAVAIDSIPIDVTLAVDTSGSVIGNLEAFKEEIRTFARMLRPGDRIRIVSFSTKVREAVPMQDASRPFSLETLTGNGMTSLNDGIIYALLWPEEPDRRHLVIALTDGEDTLSTLNSDTIPEIAGRVDAVFHAVLVPPDPQVAAASGRTTWMAGSLNAIREAVQRSGGDEHKLGRAASDFKAIFDDFRASYVLWFEPVGVSASGWHDLRVSVAGQDDLTIRARKGYFAERGPLATTETAARARRARRARVR